MRRRVRRHSVQTIAWLPVDSRLFIPLFSFGHVRGIARVFLEIEIVLSLLIVVGTVVLLFYTLIT